MHNPSLDIRTERSGPYVRAAWTTPDGTVRRENIGRADDLSPRQIREAVAKLIERHALDPASAAKPGEATLAHWVPVYIQSRDLAPRSIEETQKALDYLMEFLGRDRMMHTVTDADAVNFRRWLEQRRAGKATNKTAGKPMKPATIGKVLTYARSLFAHALKKRPASGVKANPFAEMKITRPRDGDTMGYVSLEDFEKMIALATDPASRALLGLCRLAGLRSNEAQRLTWADIQWQHPPTLRTTIPLDKHGRKREGSTKHSEREIPIQPRLMELLREAFESGTCQDGPCCDLGSVPYELTRVAIVLRVKAGLPDYGKPLHSLRKSCEDDWLAKYPLPKVAYWIGHSPAVAITFYARPTPEDVVSVTGPAPTPTAPRSMAHES